MKLLIEGHPFQYEMESLARMFLEGRRLETVLLAQGEQASEHNGLLDKGEDWILTAVREEGTRRLFLCVVCLEGQLSRDVQMWEAPQGDLSSQPEGFDSPNGISSRKEQERLLAVALYRALSQRTGKKLPWGILTGIRPAKLVYSGRERGMTDAQIARFLEEKDLVSPQKVQLLLDTADREEKILNLSGPLSYSLYVSIPFCPTRCSYCSFVSHSVDKAKKLVPEYVELLCREIAHTGRLVRDLGLRLETVYFGGGTPTTLSAEQLDRLFCAVEENFDLSCLREYTVEAGRPDTITREKLVCLKSHGVGRISINPQTFNDQVLEEIGRRHTAAQTLESYELARSVGFDTINMDLIAGLAGDSLESFSKTVDRAMELQPENVTLHTLTVKRASRLAKETTGRNVEGACQDNLVEKMLAYGYSAFAQNGYHPYYLYRQKGTVENLENVGFCQPGHEGMYNVFIMSEVHSIIAVGAGGVTKLRQPGGDRIERIFNFKYPYEYISRMHQILERKKLVRTFYEPFLYTQSQNC